MLNNSIRTRPYYKNESLKGTRQALAQSQWVIVVEI